MKRRDEVLVGIFTTIAVAVGILGALWLARGGLSSGYPLYATFPWAQGLKQGQPVFLAGVTVGYVDRIELDQNAGRVSSPTSRRRSRTRRATPSPRRPRSRG
jgi:ABC-type transporter Mla subunit MlaD